MSNKLDLHVFYRINKDSNIISVILNENFTILYFNRRAGQLLSFNPDNDIGKNLLDLDYEWSPALKSYQIDKIQITESPYSLPDITFRNKDSDEVIIGLTIRMIDMQKPDPIYVITGQDITQKRRDEKENIIGEKLRAVGELASGIAHDISSPLQFINDNLNYIREVCREMSDSEAGTICEAAAESLTGLEQIKELTSALRNFIHSDDSEIEVYRIDDILQDAVSISRNQWKKCAGIELSVADDIQTAEGYPAALTRVIINLIVNAAQAIESAGSDEGKIIVKAEAESDRVRITVSDNGPGIPEHIRKNVFDPFFTTKPRGVGTGQGLAICSSIISGKFGGDIRFRENNPTGSVFEIRIPKKVGQ